MFRNYFLMKFIGRHFSEQQVFCFLFYSILFVYFIVPLKILLFHKCTENLFIF